MPTETEPRVRMIPLEEIEVTDLNPRARFEEAALESLTASIEDKGLLQPVLVRPIDENGDGPGYELVSGERRLRAHRRLERETIRAEVRELTETEAAELRLVENIEREDLHPMEEAAAYRELLEDEDWAVADIADRVGRSEGYVYSRLKLTDLVAEPREAFLREETLSFGHARLIARLDAEEQRVATRAVTERVFGFHDGKERDAPLSVQGLRQWIEDHLHLNLQHAPFSMDDEELYPEMGACRDCPFRSGTQPELFEDVDEPTICTKPSCYNEKVERTIHRKVEELEEEGVEPLVGIATGYRAPSEEDWEAFDRILALGGWQCGATRITDENRCGHQIRGVCISGEERGEYIEVCLGEDCEEHAQAATSNREPPDPFEQWSRSFRRERYRWRMTHRREIGRQAAAMDLDYEDVEVLRLATLRIFDGCLYGDRMEAASELLGWPEMPDGYCSESEEAVAWREAIRERIDAMDRAELVRTLWVLSLSRLLDGGQDNPQRLEEWRSYGALTLLSTQGVTPHEIRDAATERRLKAGEKVLPEYIDTVIHSGDPEEAAHLVAEGEDEPRCGSSSLEGHARLRPGDEELDEVDIHVDCLRAFFDDELREEPAKATPDGVQEDVYAYVRERMEEDPDVANRALYDECEERFPDAGIDDLSVRQFHARYPLQVKRAMAQEAAS